MKTHDFRGWVSGIIKLIKIRPPRIAQALVIFAAFLHWATPLRVALFSNRVLGAIILASGLAVMLAGWWLFKVRRTAICPTDTPSVLITDGIYRFTRNPMYLGLVTMLLGLAVIIGTLPFYGAAVAYFIAMDIAFCPYEERKLEQLFADDFHDYTARVRRWV